MVGTITPAIDPIAGETVALPGGGFAIASLVSGSVVIQKYAADGSEDGSPIVAATEVDHGAILGSFQVSADGERFAAALYWAGGDRFGDIDVAIFAAEGPPDRVLVPLDTPAHGTRTYNEPLDIVPTADGGFLVLEIQRYSGRAESLLSVTRLSADGEQLGAPVEIEEYITGGAVMIGGDGSAFVISQVASYPSGNNLAVLWRIGDDGGPLGGPVTLVPSVPDGTEQARFTEAAVLANGDRLVSWNLWQGGNAPTNTLFQRYDASGNAIGDAVVTAHAAGFSALQDGGFVVIEGPAPIPWYPSMEEPGPITNLLRVFDADNAEVGTPLAFYGAYSPAAISLADGRVLTSAGTIFDDGASHDAQWGGTSTYIATWQEQELLTRTDGIDFLVSDAGVAMKPWIANFQAASDADGINATANALANHLLGGNGANVFIAGAGNDKLYGLGGNDWLLGEAGDDLLDGGAGHDVLIGGLGNDSIAAGAGADTVAGDQGDDAVSGGAGNDIVQGGAGDDLVNGDAGNDTLSGGSGRDWLNGGTGDDIISGDRGADTLEGGTGADQFRFGPGSGHDIVLDFEYGAAGDRIVIDLPADGIIDGLTIDAAAGLFDAAEDTESGVRIALGEGNSILLAGWQKADLGADIFVLV